MLAPLVVVIMILAAVYGPFLRNPLVFDDVNVLDGQVHREYLDALFKIQLRWLPYATFEWTRVMFGPDLLWQRLGNLLLHAANGILLFFLIRRLLQVCLQASTDRDRASPRAIPGAPGWFALAGATLFLLHPAAVYGVAYLVQRTILMVTLFSLLMWLLCLEGSLRKNPVLLWGSVLCYALAVFSKEHAVMAPAVSLALLVLIAGPSWRSLKTYLPMLAGYGLIALFVLIQIRNGKILGQVYEPRGGQMLASVAGMHQGFDPRLAHPLSVITQASLFFKYLLIWIAPNPVWMSVDMVEPFATTLFAWPQTAGFLGFLAYLAVSVYLLLQGGGKGLAGFAMLSPCLMFFPEFSTVRIQEPFVLYRSYLWMALPIACVPALLWRVTAKRAAILLAAWILVLLPTTWNRLSTFSNELLLWNDAARLLRDKADQPGAERIYLNRGIAFYEHGRAKEAIQDLNRALAITPWNIAVLTSRGAAFLALDRTGEALHDFEIATRLNPGYAHPYLGKGRAHELRGEPRLARESYRTGCRLGSDIACSEFRRINP